MAEHERILGWLLETVRLMVDKPDDVTVRPILGENAIVLRVNVHSSDIGKIIGSTGYSTVYPSDSLSNRNDTWQPILS